MTNPRWEAIEVNDRPLRSTVETKTGDEIRLNERDVTRMVLDIGENYEFREISACQRQ